MSYLMLPDGIPDFSKAVISFWFRVPKETLDATAAAYVHAVDAGDNIPPFNGITPLVVFGPDDVKRYTTKETVTSTPYVIQNLIRTDPYIIDPGTGNITNIYGPHHFHVANNDPFPPGGSGIYQSFSIELDQSYPRDPCYIGIDCNAEPLLGWGGETTQPNVLRINLQFLDIGTGSGAAYSSSRTGPTLVQANYFFDEFSTPTTTANVVPYAMPDGSIVDIIADTGIQEIDITFNDKSNIWFKSKTEYCVIKPDVAVTPDQWHHVLLSFDLSGTITATGRMDNAGQGVIETTCKIWLAYDDVNIKGPQLLKGTYLNDPTSMIAPGDNDLFTQNAANTAFTNNNSDFTNGPFKMSGYIFIEHVSGMVQPVYSYTAPIRSVHHPLGIPATAKYVDKIRKIEMAEFLMFTGVTLDTGIEKNRRLFITAPNKNGDQFPTNQAPIMVPINKSAIGDATTWEPGADTPAFAPGLLDPSSVPSANKPLGIAEVDFTKCSFNWMMGRNLGKAKGKVVRTGKVKAYSPDPKLKSGS